MADKFERKVSRGEPLRISAAMYNDIVDAVRWFKRNANDIKGGANLFDPIKSNLTILIKNQIGFALDSSFKIVRLSSPLVDVPTNTHGMNRRAGFDAYVPVSAADAIAITQTPCSYDALCPAVVSGVTVCKVLINDASDEWASPVPGETGYLSSSNSGQARILWYGDSGVSGEAAAGIYLAVVHLVGVAGDLDSDSGGDSPNLDIDLVTNLCPVFEEVTYADALAELYTLLSLATGFGAGKVLSNDSGTLEWVDMSAGSGGTTDPAGADTEIQYNDGGVFGASSAFTFNDSTNVFTTPNLTNTGSELHTGVIADTQSTQQDDYNPTGLAGASAILLNCSSSFTITGIAGGSSGRRFTIHNTGSGIINLADEHASSTAANRLLVPGTLGYGIRSKESATLQYDGTASRWRVVAAVSSRGTSQTLWGVSVGGTGSDMSATGGSNYIVKQTSVGGAFTAALLVTADLPGGNWVGDSCGSTEVTSYTISASSGTWVDTGGAVTLPSAGKYRITCQVRGELQNGTTGTHRISAKLYNATDAADVSGSETLVVLSSQNGVLENDTAVMTAILTIASSKTINLYVKRIGTTFTVSQILSDTNGRTKITWEKLAS